MIPQDQMRVHLDYKEIQALQPSRKLIPKRYTLHAGQSVLVGALARVDLLDGGSDSEATLTFFASPNTTLHPTRTDKADALYTSHAATRVLAPPFGGAERMKVWGEEGGAGSVA